MKGVAVLTTVVMSGALLSSVGSGQGAESGNAHIVPVEVTETIAHTPLEISYIAEVNRLRSNPKAYILSVRTYLANNAAKGEREIAERELIPMLDTMKRLETLQESASLRQDMDQHKGVNMAKQTVGHDQAFSWRKTQLTYLSENIGSRSTNNTPQTIVIQLLIDLGVPDRGHRHNLLDPDVTHTAVRRVEFKEQRKPVTQGGKIVLPQKVWWIQAFARF